MYTDQLKLDLDKTLTAYGSNLNARNIADSEAWSSIDEVLRNPLVSNEFWRKELVYEEYDRANIRPNYPEQDSPNEAVGFVILSRKHWWPGDRTTRLHEFGPRLKRSLELGGIPAELCYLEDFAADSGSLISSRANVTADRVSLLLDLDCPPYLVINEDVGLVMQALRPLFHKVIPYILDYWRIKNWLFKSLSNYSELYDFLWLPNVVPPPRDETGNLVTSFPLPLGLTQSEYERLRTKTSIARGVGFVGNVEYTNISRLFWLLELSKKVQVSCDFSDRTSSAQCPVADYIRYLDRLTNSHIVLNLSSRSDHSKTVTGRTVEAIALGKPLIQQDFVAANKSMFSPGEHFEVFRYPSDVERIMASAEALGQKSVIGMQLYDVAYREANLARHFRYLIENVDHICGINF
jgi:hypothetical protein